MSPLYGTWLLDADLDSQGHFIDDSVSEILGSIQL